MGPAYQLALNLTPRAELAVGVHVPVKMNMERGNMVTIFFCFYYLDIMRLLTVETDRLTIEAAQAHLDARQCS